MFPSGCPACSHYTYSVLCCPSCMQQLHLLCCLLLLLQVAAVCTMLFSGCPVCSHYTCCSSVHPVLSHQTTENQQTPARLSKSLIHALDDAVVPIGIQRNAAIFIVVITISGTGLCHTSLSCVAIQVWDCHRCHK